MYQDFINTNGRSDFFLEINIFGLIGSLMKKSCTCKNFDM